MGPVATLLRAAIRGYQLFLAPLTAGSCRFAPSCSHYAMEAVERHGPWRGGRMALWRILRCNPWGGSGFDPVCRPSDCESHRGEETKTHASANRMAAR